MDRKSKLALQEEIIQAGEPAFDPALPEDERKRGFDGFETFLDRTSALLLLPALTGLLQPERVKPWMRPYLVYTLSCLALRPKGVRSIIEFVLSVHPSSSMPAPKPEDGAPKGPPISMEALKMATSILSNPPLTPNTNERFNADEWFQKLAPQLFHLLDGQGGLEMVKVASYVIGYGILGRREFGARGSPGWKAIVEPIIGNIDPSVVSSSQRAALSAGITTIRPEKVLVTSIELGVALRRLASLVSSHPNPSLSKRLLTPIILPLWSLASWPCQGTQFEDYRGPAGYLLSILFKLSSDPKLRTTVSNGLMFDGDYRSGEPWKFVEEGTTGIRIEKRDRTEVTNYFETGGDLDLKVADHKVKMYIDVLKLTDDESNNSISVQYLRMIKSWMLKDEEAGEVLLRPSSERPPRNVDEIIRMHRTPQQKVVDTKILQTMTDEASNKLVSDSAGAVDLITSVLSRDTKVKTAKFDDQDDTTALVLSLLNMVLTNPSFMVATIAPDMLSSLKNSLQIMAKSDAEVSSTARNLLMLLEFKLMNPNADAEEASLPSSAQDKIAEDRKTYKLALDYLTSPTNPTPVRAQGLDLLTSLISTNSPVLDVPATIILLSSLLQDGEEYIYLRTIKAFIALSNKNSKTVSNSLLDRYFDAEEDLQLDARLRLGEALTQVIEKSGQLFTGDMARHVCEGLLALAGRRGYRPKTEKEKAKRLRKEELDKKRAEREWGGAVPLLDDIAEDEEEDPEVTQVLNQIVTGWEGKRGEEDVRIRASALSIFGVAVETNIMGIGAATVAGGVDLSINILPLEAEPEKAILRRAAVLTVLSVLRAHEKAKEKGKTLGFGFDQGVKDIERVIGYVKDTDNDGLVRQHAKDVLEELESWKLQPLGAQQQSGGVITELGGLRGLNIGSQTASGAGSGMKSRPKIEEIE